MFIHATPPAAGASAYPPPLDGTAETLASTPAAVTDELTKRAELVLLDSQISSQVREARLDRMRMDFDAAQKERAELLREMDLLRDMATEQMKQDDANLKKWIAMI